MGSPGRGLWQAVIKNLFSSLKPRQFRGNLVGVDHLGNKYYEIPADPSTGKRRDSRWFDPPVAETFDQEMPSEWASWLRARRKLPPTEEEIQKNMAIMKMKKVNAAYLESEEKQKKILSGEEKVEKDDPNAPREFPKYEEYERMPGTFQDKIKPV